MSRVILPVHSLINNDVVFNWHSGMTDNGLAKTIKSHNIGHSKQLSHLDPNGAYDPCTLHCRAWGLDVGHLTMKQSND